MDRDVQRSKATLLLCCCWCRDTLTVGISTSTPPERSLKIPMKRSWRAW